MANFAVGLSVVMIGFVTAVLGTRFFIQSWDAKRRLTGSSKLLARQKDRQHENCKAS